MTIRTAVLAAALALVARPALADGLRPPPPSASTPGHLGTAYYTVEATDYRVVVGNGSPRRHEALTLASALLSGRAEG